MVAISLLNRYIVKSLFTIYYLYMCQIILVLDIMKIFKILQNIVWA